MRKKLCLLAMTMLCVCALRAQVYVTPEAGMTAFRKNDSRDKTWTAGWKAGAAVEYRFRQSFFSLQSGAYFMNRAFYENGTQIDTDNEYLTVAAGNANNRYLQVPLLAKFNVKLTDRIELSAAAGPYAGFSLNASRESSSAVIQYNDLIGGYHYVSPYYDPFLSIYGGFGYGSGYNGLLKAGDQPTIGYSQHRSNHKLGNDYGLMFRLNLDVSNFVIGLAYDLTMRGNRNIIVDYRTFNVSFGYKFRLGK
jgi:hypothetical protein